MFRVQFQKFINGFSATFTAIALIFALQFVTGGTELKAQCPTGYTPRVVNLVVNGCTYEVHLCVKCSTGPVPTQVQVTGFIKVATIPACIQAWNAEQVLTDIEFQVRNYDFVFNFLCNPRTGPPCPTQSDPIQYWSFPCWLQEPDGFYHPCDYDTYCYEVDTYCYDSLAGKYQKTVVTGPTMVGTPDCTLEAGEAEQGECFIHHTNCGN